MTKKRGQAALEFLMTYGWAILAAVVVVGVLWYMIGNPANLAGDDFQIGAPFVKMGTGMSVNETGYVQLEIRNGGGNTVNITSVGINADTGICTSITPNTNYAPGNVSIHAISCTGLTSGDRLTGDVTINYLTSGSSLVSTAKGTIRAVLP